MKFKTIFSGLGVLAIGGVIAVTVFVRNQKTAVGGQVPEIRTTINQMALESPEEFQAQTSSERDASRPLVVPAERPKQLSEVRKQVAGVRAQETEPVPASDLYFWTAQESLRKDEIRDPDSEENREGIVQLMKARQRRVSK